MPRKQPAECKHSRAEAGDICPDCGTEVEDPAVEKLAEKLEGRVAALLKKAKLLPEEEKSETEEEESLHDRIFKRKGKK